MHFTKGLLGLPLMLALVAAKADAGLNVVATIPDFGEIARVVGGDKVKVTSICRATEDAHFVDARPSFIRLLNQADVLIEGGAELEVGWLPPLVNNARNSKILSDAPGHIVLAQGIHLLEVPTGPIDRSMGDVHPLGNPHFWLDPANARIMADTVGQRLGKIDPANAAYYQSNLEKFNARLAEKLAEWEKTLAPYRGIKVITYHKSFSYFLHRFGFELAGTIEPKPGIEPSPSHINSLIAQLKEQKIPLVILEPYRPRKTPEYIAKALGAKLVLLPDKVGGNEQAKDFFSLFDFDVTQIAAALRETK